MTIQPSLPRLATPGGPSARRRTAVTRHRLRICADVLSAGHCDRGEALLSRLCGDRPTPEVRERVLASTARALGERWTDDSCDFATLTLAMCRLHAVLRRTSCGPPSGATVGAPRRALFAAAPGEQHAFGAALLAQTFHEAGWDVAAPQAATAAELTARVRTGGEDLVGLSLACDAGLERLAGLVAELRSAARRRGLLVLVGGRVFLERPELAGAVGADGTAADCLSALALAEERIPAFRAAA